MSWRSVIISNPAHLSLGQGKLHITQGEGVEKNTAKVPLEDISVMIIDQPQVILSAQLLAACAEAQIVVITVDERHLPNGMFLPYLPHSRAFKVIKAQLNLSQPAQKRIWQRIVQQKIYNQANVLSYFGQSAKGRQLIALANRVRSGDPENIEGQAAQAYFPSLFGVKFVRQQERFYNAALNYGYAVLRAAIARTLCGYGFLPVFGLFHRSELNRFNLADDLIEPYRPLLDAYVLKLYPAEPVVETLDIGSGLTSPDKANIANFLHQDICLTQRTGLSSTCTVLAGIEATVISLSQTVQNTTDNYYLAMPQFTGRHSTTTDDLTIDTGDAEETVIDELTV